MAVVFVGGCAAGGITVTKHRPSGVALRVAEQSFSSVPFGTRNPPGGMALIDNGGCNAGRGECTYIDSNKVQHYFSEGELVVKSLEVGHVGDRPIAPLGIGTARALDEVVKRVRRFLPEAEIHCDEHRPANPITCGATLDEGWIRLFFDGSRRLSEVRIDAYLFT